MSGGPLPSLSTGPRIPAHVKPPARPQRCPGQGPQQVPPIHGAQQQHIQLGGPVLCMGLRV